MQAVVVAVMRSLVFVVRSRIALQIEILALRHQLALYRHGERRPQLAPANRLLWAWLSRRWSGWRTALVMVQPRTVTAWKRRRFRDHWTRLSRQGQRGRPQIAPKVRDLIRRISAANPLWGAARIRGELGKLGITVAQSTIAKYRVRPATPPSPTSRTFLATHAEGLVSVDFFTVATVRFELLFVLVILAHDRRRVRHFNVTAHPTVAWTAQQVVEAFPWETAPRYLLRDRDGVYGAVFRQRVAGIGTKEVLCAPRSPWQSPYVERLIGSIRRECLNNVVVLHERHLRRLLTAYFQHYHRRRCHQALAMDRPEPRPVQGHEQGTVVEVAEGGGLYRHYERRAA